MKSKGLTSAFLMATGLSLSACATTANLRIPESLRAPCDSTVNVENAQTIGDLGKAVIQGDGDLRLCSLKKEAVIEIAESQNKRWFEFWQ